MVTRVTIRPSLGPRDLPRFAANRDKARLPPLKKNLLERQGESWPDDLNKN